MLGLFQPLVVVQSLLKFKYLILCANLFARCYELTNYPKLNLKLWTPLPPKRGLTNYTLDTTKYNDYDKSIIC